MGFGRAEPGRLSVGLQLLAAAAALCRLLRAVRITGAGMLAVQGKPT